MTTLNEATSSRPNPLRRLWDVLSLIGGIVGLASLAETWLEDLVKWRGWIKGLLESYQRIVYPVFEWLFGWLPWSIPEWFFDYLVLGMMLSASLAKGLAAPTLRVAGKVHWKEELKALPLFLLWHLGELLLWPIMFFLIVRNYICERASDFRDTLLWFGAIILGFALLLSVNVAL